MRYTEHVVKNSPTDGEGWAKLIITQIVIGPLRLINEISQKVLFLGSGVMSKVVRYALAMNCGFIVWELMAGWLTKSDPYVSYPAMFISAGLLTCIYGQLSLIKDFDYEIIASITEEEEERRLDVDTDEITAFENTAAAEVSFDDSINVFITDPEELSILGIPPALYQVAEDRRMLNAIERRGELFPNDRISIPEIFEGTPSGSRLDDNFNSLMDELEQQLTSASHPM